MTTRRALRACTAVIALLLVPVAAQPAGADTELPSQRLLLEFDSGEDLAPGSAAYDTSGLGNDGTVRTAFGGSVVADPGWRQNRSARFPEPCDEAVCPNALIAVPDDPSLDPGYASFAFGVHLQLQPDATTTGSNVLQKGLWGDPGGQWKLQVDGLDGRPSCLVSGYGDDGYQRVEAVSSVSVATGTWTRVTCHRTQDEVLVVVNGVVRGWAPMSPVWLSSSAAVTIGAKYTSYQDNDQFYGRLDRVQVRVF